MHSYHLGRSAGMLLTMIAVVVLAACTPPPSGLTESDRASIRASAEAFASGGSASDWAAVAMLYAPDAVLMPPNAPTVTGRAAIQEVFATFPPMNSMDLKVEEINGVGDMAYVRGSYALSMKVGDATVEDRGKYLEVRRKQADGSWLITVDTWNSDMPVPPPPPATPPATSSRRTPRN